MSSAAAPPRRRAAGPFHPSVIAVHACDLSLRRCYAAAERAGRLSCGCGFGLGLSEVGREDIEKNIPLLRRTVRVPSASVLRSPRGMDAYAGMGILD